MNEINISKSWVSRICFDNGKFAYKNKLVGKKSNLHQTRRYECGLRMQVHGVDYREKYLVTDSKALRCVEGMNRQNQRTTVDKGDLDSVRAFQKPNHSKGTVHVYGGLSSKGLVIRFT